MRTAFYSAKFEQTSFIELNFPVAVGCGFVCNFGRCEAIGVACLSILGLSMQQIDKSRIEDGKAVMVWDLFIRLFHWTLVLGCATAFISSEFHASEIHVLTGYALCALLAARVYWGFKGSEYARFRSFIFPVSETLAYVRSMFGKHPCKHYFGHNPAGALMVFTLLGMLAALLATGLVTLAAIDFEGPLLFLANLLSDEASYAFRHLHELLSTAGLVLVAFHLMGVVGGSIQHNENLVRAMITGKKELPVNQKENGGIK